MDSHPPQVFALILSFEAPDVHVSPYPSMKGDMCFPKGYHLPELLVALRDIEFKVIFHDLENVFVAGRPVFVFSHLVHRRPGLYGALEDIAEVAELEDELM